MIATLQIDLNVCSILPSSPVTTTQLPLDLGLTGPFDIRVEQRILYDLNSTFLPNCDYYYFSTSSSQEKTFPCIYLI